MKLHVSDATTCPRELYHKVRDGDKKLPPHYMQLKGVITHKAIELASQSEYEAKPDEVTPELLNDNPHSNVYEDDEVYQKALLEAKIVTANYLTWEQDTDIPLGSLIHEETQEVMYEGHVITGTPDAYNWDMIIDYKTGKPVFRKDHKMQLAAYRWMLAQQGKCDENAKGYCLFLGGEEPVLKQARPVEMEKGLDDFLTAIDTQLKYATEIEKDPKYKPECKPGFLCSYCGWRHQCRGV